MVPKSATAPATCKARRCYRGDVLRGEVNVIRSLAASCGRRFASYDEDRIGNRSNTGMALLAQACIRILGACAAFPAWGQPAQ
jgi:hypothetical protein